MHRSEPPTVATAQWAPLLLLVPFAAAALVDMPRVIHVGSVTALGMMTIAQCLISVVTLLALRVYPRRLLWHFAPFGLFLIWMIGRSLFAAPTQIAVQNAITYVLFGTQFLIGGTLAAKKPAVTLAMLRRGFWILDLVTLPIVVFCLLRFGLPSDSDEEIGWLVGPRSVALVAILPIAWHLSGWSHGEPRAGIRALGWIMAVTASLSRTVTGIAVIAAALAFLAHGWITPRGLLRKTPTLAAGVFAVVILLVSYAATFHQRFLEGYNNIDVGGVEISTSGRNQIWPVVIDSAMKHPITGGGLGSSEMALTMFDADVVGHPHNDYLRLWHDGGFIGLAFFLMAVLPWVRLLRRQWAWVVRASWSHPEVDFAALLALLGILLAAITDNPIVYPHVMAPGGLLVGAAIGFRIYRRDVAHVTPDAAATAA